MGLNPGANLFAKGLLFGSECKIHTVCLLCVAPYLEHDRSFPSRLCQSRIGQFRTSAGNALLNSPFDALVSAMAALAPPRMGQTTLLPAYQAALQPVIAANRVSAPCPPKPGAAALASSPPSLQKKSPEHLAWLGRGRGEPSAVHLRQGVAWRGVFPPEVTASVPCGQRALVSRHGSDVVGCAQPSEGSARRIAHPIPSVLASDATPRCASMTSADRHLICDTTLGRSLAARQASCLALRAASPPKAAIEAAARGFFVRWPPAWREGWPMRVLSRSCVPIGCVVAFKNRPVEGRARDSVPGANVCYQHVAGHVQGQQIRPGQGQTSPGLRQPPWRGRVNQRVRREHPRPRRVASAARANESQDVGEVGPSGQEPSGCSTS